MLIRTAKSSPTSTRFHCNGDGTTTSYPLLNGLPVRSAVLSSPTTFMKVVKPTTEEEKKRDFRYPVERDNIGLFEHGVTPDAKDFIAEADAEYKASKAYLDQVANGVLDVETSVDEETGRLTTRTTVIAPVGETYVPSNLERFAQRGHVGELDAQRNRVKRFLQDENSQLNLKKERQLDELLTSPMSLLKKANEVTALLEQFYDQKLSLQRNTAEHVMQLYSQASLVLRSKAKKKNIRRLPNPSDESSRETISASCESAEAVPFLKEMRQLYQHIKLSFVAPTALTVEHLMVTLSAVTAPDKTVFHLSNRLFLDCDKYVVLPTRTTYATFFDICRVNDAMTIAVARWTDSVKHLHIPTDPPMLTSLLKGLNERGYVQEAIALLAATTEVPLTTPLVNASLESFLLSEDPHACFSLYEGVVREGRVRPDAETYTLLLLACEKSGQWENTTLFLADMQRRKLKGSPHTLNLLLKGLLQEGLTQYGRAAVSKDENEACHGMAIVGGCHTEENQIKWKALPNTFITNWWYISHIHTHTIKQQQRINSF